MANVKTAVSLQKSLFEQVDSLAREMNISRSRLFVLALEDFIHRYQNRQLLEQINQAYSDTHDPDEQSHLERMQVHQRKLVEGEW
jgi:metal-responsive CopG/Arc/MetJ family transcriptional regulator